MERRKRKPTGFTLIEVLTVSGIMALFSLTLISLLLSTIRSGNKAQVVQNIRQDGNFALKAMARTIRNALEVDCSGDFTLTDVAGETTTFTAVDYDWGDETVTRIASNSSEFLTGVRSGVSDLNFTCYEGNLGNQVVTISFTLAAGKETGAQAQEKFSQDFSTSVATRNY